MSAAIVIDVSSVAGTGSNFLQDQQPLAKSNNSSSNNNNANNTHTNGSSTTTVTSSTGTNTEAI
ncbi:virulence factor PGA16-like [Rhagoletis pomonella]|uniref:virulence factor PGA16-like n=1 Tax=Rhagoletis pomonella TaxID=28610 RepID=UPI00177E645D|nr:virulence factor PGA16-like [Rhagoletis pomonella]